MKKLTIFLIASVLYPMLSFGQANTITLVASGDGASKTEAESTAIRSAIEQAFGTFVSANTTILNDDVVKDEIATISSGNIESYNIVAESETSGRWYVTVKAVVSINKLVDYAKSHGSSTEFAGQNFAMQMKMRKLNKENEEKVLSDLLVEVEQVASNISFFDYGINQEEPKLVSDSEYKVPIRVTANWNENGKKIVDLINNTFCSLSLSSSEQESYKSNNYSMGGCILPKNITGDKTLYILRSDEYLLFSIIEQLQVCLLKNLHCFSIVRKGNGEGYKTFLCPLVKLIFQEIISGFEIPQKFTIDPVLPEEVLYETEGFEVVPDPTLGVCKPQMVDLGLSVKWADLNVGGSPIHPFGNYYAWGELCPKLMYTPDTYKWSDEDGEIIKYNNEDSRTVLEMCDDVAHFKFGDKWRIPTYEEFKELYDNCTSEWTAENGVYGRKFTSKKNGNSIFLPAAGLRQGYNPTCDNFEGNYWSSSISSGGVDSAYYLFFQMGEAAIDIDNIKRDFGYSIRPISE